MGTSGETAQTQKRARPGPAACAYAARARNTREPGVAAVEGTRDRPVQKDIRRQQEKGDLYWPITESHGGHCEELGSNSTCGRKTLEDWKETNSVA